MVYQTRSQTRRLRNLTADGTSDTRSEVSESKTRKRSKPLRFPVEIILHILSFMPPSELLSSQEISIRVDGLLFHVLFNTSLLRPHYDTTFRRKWTLETVSGKTMSWSILREMPITTTLDFHVKLKQWPLDTLESRFFRLLIATVPHRWKTLTIPNIDKEDSMEIIKACYPCLPHLRELHLRQWYELDATPWLNTMIFKDIAPRVTSTLTILGFPLHLLQEFYESGSLKLITQLILYSGYYRDQGFAVAITTKRIPNILSKLTRLRELKIYNMFYRNEDIRVDKTRLTKIKSDTLRSLTVHPAGDYFATTILPLFQDCVIETLDIRANSLKCFYRYFPHVKRLIFVSPFNLF